MAYPIPWRDIYQYAQFAQLDNELFDHFIYVIRSMDSGYLEANKPKVDGND